MALKLALSLTRLKTLKTGFFNVVVTCPICILLSYRLNAVLFSLSSPVIYRADQVVVAT